MTVHLPSVKPRYEPCVYFARRAAAVKIGFSPVWTGGPDGNDLLWPGEVA